MNRMFAAAVAIIGLIFPASAQDIVKIGDIEIVAPFSRATLPNAPTGGAYFSLVNTGSEDDRLLSATSPVSGDVQLHEMKIENNVARMRDLPDGIPLPAGQTVTLEPSGTHIMLTKLTGPLIEGETVPITLTFEHAGDITLNVPIAHFAARKAP